MRNLILAVWLLVPALGFASNLSAILSLKKGAVISKKDFQRLAFHPEIKKIGPLFTKDEKKILKSLSADYLSSSWLVELKSDRSFDRIEASIRRLGLPLNLDWNEIKVTAQQFSDEQWGLLNRGLPQNVDLDQMLVYRVQARQGEDIHLPSPRLAPKKIRVAVLDTGVDYNHPDMKNVVVTRPSECAALEKFKKCSEEKKVEDCEKIWMDISNPEVDQDKNGYPLDCHGWSIPPSRPQGKLTGKIIGKPEVMDLIGHGTHVAGIIAAQRDNGIGVDGVSSNIEILPVQVISKKPNEPLKPLSVDLNPIESGEGDRKDLTTLASLVARGVLYAIHSKAQVMNFSLGWPQDQDSKFMRQVVEEAQARGVIIVAAAGNDSTQALLRPCAYKGVLCVGAHGPDGAISHFSNYGGGVEIFAPGLNILSTYPENLRPIRFRKNLGYEFLSGTSQATPFVSGVVGEMLARGIPSEEIVARLILGSRSVQRALPLTEGSPHSISRVLPEDPLTYEKWGRGGLIDVEKALSVAAEPLIVAANKEKIGIEWDRVSSELVFEIEMKNLWQDVATAQVQIHAEMKKPHLEAIRPQIVSVEPADNYGSVWKSQEARRYRVKSRIVDSQNPSLSRIPSEMNVEIAADVSGHVRFSSVALEISVPIKATSQGADIQEIPLLGMPQGRTEITPIDQNLDKNIALQEYVVTKQNEKDEHKQQVWTLQYQNGKYAAVGGTEIELQGDMDKIVLHFASRMDWNLDGKSDYVLGFVEDTSDVEDAVVSPFTFFVFDSNMKLINSFRIDSKLAQMPKEIFWHRMGQQRLPSWVGSGRDPDKKRGLRDRWENPEDREDLEIRFYYINEEKKLKALKTHEGFNFIDILQPTQEQVIDGRVPVLLAKNLGTEAKPSYLYEFAVAEVLDGKVENFRLINFFGDEVVYRNILDTRVDRIISLEPKEDYLRGTFWFSEGKPRQQRLTTLDNRSFKLHDYNVGALRAQFDSALYVRGVFSGRNDQFAYVLTNSEIQLHHLNKNRVSQTSLERYSFIERNFFANLYFPFTLRSNRDDTMLPALLVPEGSGLNRGVKMLAPIFAYNGDVVELVSPARLRFSTETKNGCRPMETPVIEGERGTSLDFYCGQKFLRVNLAF